MVARRVGGPEGWALKPAGVSHDSPRAQTCTLEGPGLQKHHQNSTRRPPEREREKKSENGDGRGKKQREILGGLAEGGPAEGGSGGGGSGGGNEKKKKAFEK